MSGPAGSGTTAGTVVAAGTAVEDLATFLKAGIAGVVDGERLFLQVADCICELRGEVAMTFLKQIAGSPASSEIDDEMLTTGQVADLLGVSRPSVVALIDNGLLPAIRLGTHRRVRRIDTLAYLEQSRTRRSDAMVGFA